MRKVAVAVIAGLLVLGGYTACSAASEQSTPCESSHRAIQTQVNAMNFAHVDTDYPGQIVSFCERGDSGTVEVFTNLPFSFSPTKYNYLCQRIFNAATNGIIPADGLKHVVVRIEKGSKATTCGAL